MSAVRPSPWSAVMLAAGLAGCSALEDQSCELASSEMSAVFLVVDSGLDIRAAVDFERGDRRGQGAPLRLCDADRLTINGRSPSVIEKADRIEYALTVAPDAGRRFDFVLERTDEGERIAFGVDLPAAFEILAPEDGAPLSLEESQRVEWAPGVADGTVQVGLNEALGGGQCLVAEQPGHTYEERGGVAVPDTGEWTIPAGVVDTESIDPCVATYALTRLARGDYPEVLGQGGRVEARVERYRDVVVVP